MEQETKTSFLVLKNFRDVEENRSSGLEWENCISSGAR